MDNNELGIDPEVVAEMEEREQAARSLANSANNLRAHAVEILTDAKDLDDPKLIKGQVDLAQAFLRAARDVEGSLLTNEDD